MDILVPLFWVIVIIIWIVSALAKKQAGTSQGEPPTGEGGYRKPEEAIERFLRRLSGEEEIKVVPPFEPIVERVAPPPPPPEPEPTVERVTPPKVEEPVYKVEPLERREEIRSPLLGTLDISTIRQGIILSEILGPPRGEKPL